jgi:hypothetical protein
LGYSIHTLIGEIVQLEHPLMDHACPLPIMSIIKPGEYIKIGKWDQKEWTAMIANTMNFQEFVQRQVGEGIYKITAMGVTKDIVIGLNTPQCPVLTPPIC